MSRWFRVYDDLVDDPKVQCLSPELFRALLNIWCIASRNDGRLPATSQVAFSLRVKVERAALFIAQLVAAGLVDEDEDGFQPHNWDARQYRSDGSSGRVKQFRERQRNGACNDDETLHQHDLKRPQRQKTDTEQIAEAEKKETRARGALAAGWPPDYREQFWQAYPHRIGKADAMRKLDRLARTDGKVGFETLMFALHAYANKSDDRPFCNPATWINQERWTDQPAPGNGARNGHVQTASPLIAAADRLVEVTRERAERSRRESGIFDRAGPAPPGPIPPGRGE